MRNLLPIAIVAVALADPAAFAADPPLRRAKIERVDAVKTYADFLQLPPGFSKRAYYELAVGPGSIGYSDAILESKKVGDEVHYAYTHAMVLRFEDGTRAEVTITAELSTQFVPYWAKTARSTITPNGEVADRNISTTVNKDVVIIRDTSQQQPSQREVPRGPAPFVMALDAALEMVDFKGHATFLLYEFDPESGSAELLGFKSKKSEDGTWSIEAGVPMGARRYRIKFGADGKLLEWRNDSGGLVIKRCSKERMEACKAQANMG